MKTLFLFILFVQSSLHLWKFYRAYCPGNVVKLKNYISRPFGLLWLISGLLFLGVLLLVLSNIKGWPFFAIAAVLLSQTLIILYWKKARFGSLLNIPIVLWSLSHLGIFDLDLLL